MAVEGLNLIYWLGVAGYTLHIYLDYLENTTRHGLMDKVLGVVVSAVFALSWPVLALAHVFRRIEK